MKKKKNKKKITSPVELERREMQRRGSFYYTPDGMVFFNRVKGGYKLNY